MSSNEKREIAVPKYFIKTPEKPKSSDAPILLAILAIAGLPFVIWGLSDMPSTVPILCIAAPIVWFAGQGWITMQTGDSKSSVEYEKTYKLAEPKPSDEQIDNWRNSDLERIKKESLDKLDLLPSQVIGNPDEPIMVVGPSAGANAALGKDNIIRFSSHDVVIVYLTDYHLAAYSCTIDLSKGLPTLEATQEYHYKDVVSVATQTDNSRIFKVKVNGQDKPLANYQKFALSVASGERIEVAVSFPQIDDVIKNARLAPTGAENAVKMIRARLREKKGGVQE